MAPNTQQTAPAAAAGALAAAGGAAAVAVKRARDRNAQRTSAERARAYRLRRGEDTGDGVRRIARGQLDLAGERLDAGAGARGDLDGAVHETRKAFKRLRALVRVARDALGDEVYRRENTIFRDAGRRLSSARDATVLVQTLDALTARYRDELGDDAFAGLRDALAGEAAAASRALAERPRHGRPGPAHAGGRAAARSAAGRCPTTGARPCSSRASSASTVAAGAR